jgi:hypothetical protein
MNDENFADKMQTFDDEAEIKGSGQKYSTIIKEGAELEMKSILAMAHELDRMVAYLAEIDRYDDYIHWRDLPFQNLNT